MRDVVLYTTVGCHLCELAEHLLLPLVEQGQIRCELIDIAEDDQLLDRYGERIPVLLRPDNHQELGWPFTAQQLQQFI